MNLSEHFTLEELTATDIRGFDNVPDGQELKNLHLTATLMEDVRNRLYGHPIIIRSGYRCKEVNKRVGGAVNSSHMQGLAVDFICPGFGTPREIVERLRTCISFDQLIHENTWVHISWKENKTEQRNQILQAHFKDGKTTYSQFV